MFFIANESVKIQTYYIPVCKAKFFRNLTVFCEVIVSFAVKNLGPAPKWCGFLDALTEELEESSKEVAYDDYMFVTRKQLEEVGLTHLIGNYPYFN